MKNVSVARLAALFLAVLASSSAQLTPGWRACSTGRDLARAFAEGDGALLTADITLSQQDWDGLSIPIVIAANRSFTVAGVADETRRGLLRGPTLDLAAEDVRAKIRLEPGASLTFRNLVLVHWREGSSNQAPGVSLVAPVVAAPAPAGTAATPPPVTIVRLEHVGMLYRYCFPMSLAKPAAAAFRRPDAMPGTNSYEWDFPWPANCINSTWARPMERCYTYVGRYLDVASAGADVDSLGRPTLNGYYVQYLDAIGLCTLTMPEECIARLRPVGCSLFLNAQPEEPPPPAPPPQPPYAPPQPLPDADMASTIVAGTDGGGSSGDSDQTGAVVGAAVGGAVGGCLVLALAAVAVVMYRRRRHGSAAAGTAEASAAAGARSDMEAGGAPCPASALNAGNSSNACVHMEVSSTTTAATSSNIHDSDLSSATGSKGRITSPAGIGARGLLGLGSLASSSGPLEGGDTDDVVTHQTPVRKDVKLNIHLNSKPAAATTAAISRRESPSSAALDSLVNLMARGPSAPGTGGRSGGDGVTSPATDTDGRRPPEQSGERETEREGGVSSLLALQASGSSMVTGTASEVKLTPVMLGKGAFGRVMVGEWNGQQVAVKVVADTHKWGGSQDVLLKCFAHEVEILARCQHPNILRLLAACPRPPRLCLVTELMETSLDGVLHGGTAMRLSLRKVLYIAAQIARGLAYLHPTIVHRDVKPGNILLNDAAKSRPVVKISDFGLSRLRSTVLITATPGAGTPGYLAPECFEQGVMGTITHKADIFSLGVVIWEMLTRERPWDGVAPLGIAVGVAREQRRLPLSQLPPNRCPPELKALVEQCWDKDPLRRPAAAELSKILEKMELDLVQPAATEESEIRPAGPEPEASPEASPSLAVKDAGAAREDESDEYEYGPILAVSLAGDQRY
ncbi:hypothetical protein HYH03_004140 [Edaphochlamys debaryana]|uniref:Protein kinase domain-containing protein n=1 Tax=Edaphochlamys debaryana TaxID=47281 RepID=A0A836C3N8_9CHLO|nr:hypothetical protein HYH03_004140 [Edaphochlamys debaryana]|eukprot:KAG2497874.1 hypothetical protein HYH03_004140 [Edaphochlamys debaryana]